MSTTLVDYSECFLQTELPTDGFDCLLMTNLVSAASVTSLSMCLTATGAPQCCYHRFD